MDGEVDQYVGGQISQHCHLSVQVVRAYDAAAGGPTGPALRRIGLGDIVTVTVQLTTPDEISGLLVEDWLPAGLEPLDAPPDAPQGAWWAAPCALWWRCTSFRRELRTDRVAYYASYAHAGTHTLSYQAIAATAGNFSLPPARAMASLEPDIMGLSSGGDLLVGARGTPHAALPPPPPPRACPAGCTGRGVCNARTGTCACDAASAGADCSAPRVAPMLGALGGDHRNRTVAVRGGASLQIELPLHRALGEAGGGGGDAHARAPAFAYAVSMREAALPSASLALSPLSATALALRIAAPDVVEMLRCVNVLVAASDDGVLFTSLRMTVWLLPRGHDGAPAAGSSEACDSSWDHVAEEATSGRVLAARLFGLAAAALLCGAAYAAVAPQRASWHAAGSEAGNELEKLSSEDASSDHETYEYGGSISEEEKGLEDGSGRLIT